MQPINEYEICSIVSRFKPKSSKGYDGISNDFLKKIVNCIKLPLCIIFNKSIESGIFPDLMKTAIVKPLFKSGDTECCDNYRPISLLPVISKVLEKNIYYRVVDHMETNNILYPKQFGFRRKHSMTDAISIFLSDLLKGGDEQMNVISIFIDLKKAFDTVNHTLILDKLIQLGIEDTNLNWFKSYLTNRIQCTQIGDCISETAVLGTGVPQGSLLGVLLFQIFINDMPKALKFCSGILYADDTTIYILGRNVRFMQRKLQSDINQVSMWLKENSLKLNVAKTKLVFFNNKGLTPYIDIEIDGELIENVKELKFLGITLDCELTFTPHYQNVYKKVSKLLFIMRKLAQFVPKGLLRHLYYAYFHSIVSYGMYLWGNQIKKSLLDNLYRVQKRLIRIINNEPYHAHCMPLFKKSEITTITDILYIENVKLMHKVVNHIAPKPVVNIFLTKSSNLNQRTKIPKAPHVKTNLVKKSLICKTLVDWSSLKLELRTLEKTRQLSKELKKSILEMY